MNTLMHKVIGLRLSVSPSGVHGALPVGERLAHWPALMACAADVDAPEVQVLAQAAARVEPRYDEIEDLVALLTESASAAAGSREEILWLAHAMSQATLADKHLWQDLHLPSRRELSALMTRWFPQLAERNHRDMKWKKFLYKQLCDKAELSICRAPSCSVCTDYAACFGPEDAVAA